MRLSLVLGLLLFSFLTYSQVPNDTCENADDFCCWGFCDFLIAYNIEDAIDEATLGSTACPTCAGGCSLPVNDIWLEFTPTDPYVEIIAISSVMNTITTNLEIFDACDGTVLFCGSVTSPDHMFVLSSVLTPGSTYYARFWYHNGEGQATIDICIGWDLLPLPVEFTSFYLESSPTKISLYWNTETELNNHGFEVERQNLSSGAWEVISFVSGKGTTTSQNSYRFDDYNPNNGNNYYRLKQIDFDGNFSYSKVIQSRWTRNVIFYPNPTVGSVTITSETDVAFKIFNIEGKLILHGQSVNQNIDVSNLEAGLYLIKLEGNIEQLYVLD